MSPEEEHTTELVDWDERTFGREDIKDLLGIPQYCRIVAITVRADGKVKVSLARRRERA